LVLSLVPNNGFIDESIKMGQSAIFNGWFVFRH
jgi:hypothetical protein